MSKFKVGDKVKHRDGSAFSNGKHIATVAEWGFGFKMGDSVALKETDTYISVNSIELVTNSPVRETTVVKKEIVPGIYGKVVAREDGGVYMSTTSDRKELQKAIETLQIIHDAME